MRPQSVLSAFAVLLASFGLAPEARAQRSPLPKDVAAPAQDILGGSVRLPEPAASAIRSAAEIVPVELAWRVGSGWSFETRVAVASDGPLALAVVSPDAGHWRTSVALPGAALEPFGSRGATRNTQLLDSDLPGWIVDRIDVADAPGGTWTVRIELPSAQRADRPAAGFLVVRDSAQIALSAHVATHALLGELETPLAARVEGALASSVDALVETEWDTQQVELFDDGLHADGVAGDGLFGARIPHGLVGTVRAHVRAAGTTSDGFPFERSALLAFEVLERRVLLSGNAHAFVADRARLRVELEALPLGPPAKLHVSAEVWGTDASGTLVPVAWLSRMLHPEARSGAWQLALHLDGRWLNVAGASAPLELRNVRVQDPDTHVVFDLAEQMPLSVAELPPVVGLGPRAITRDMLMGPAALSAAHPGAAHAPVGPQVFTRSLMLVHGYCSGGSIWPAADFTQPKLQFLDPNANRSHDEFAVLMAQTGSGLGSFGVVGHSQGGCAALHLFTYYFSPLDRAFGGRRIQSVATPYQGTPLASLGGFACGVNNDMTPAGSATWLAGIPTWARNDVWYWTTSNSGSACSIFTDFLLQNPEDGTVEQFRGQLPGGNSMGHTTGWCHTTGMTNPANYTDHARNAEMNANAAR